MEPVKKLLGDYKDEAGAEFSKAKKKGCAKSAKKIVDNIL